MKHSFLVATFGLVFSLPVLGAVVVQDDMGFEVRLNEPAQRIVTLAPHAAENMFAVGAGNKLVGTVEYSDFPPEAKKIPRVGGYSRLDLEAVAALKPDLVIAWNSGNHSSQIEKLKALGLVVFVSQPRKIDDIATQLIQMGRLSGQEKQATVLAERFSQRLKDLRERHAAKPKVRIFYQIWKSPLTTIGGGQIISDAIRVCGGENIFAALKPLAPTVSMEAVLEANPEVIVATGMGDARPEWLSDWDQWPRLQAVQQGHLYHINPDIMQRHTVRILDGTERLCGFLETARSKRKGLSKP